jgi:hypothetical protein
MEYDFLSRAKRKDTREKRRGRRVRTSCLFVLTSLESPIVESPSPKPSNSPLLLSLPQRHPSGTYQSSIAILAATRPLNTQQ